MKSVPKKLGETICSGLLMLIVWSVAVLPTPGHAQTQTPDQGKTCNGVTLISYSSVPVFDNLGSIDRVRISLGTGPIESGNTLTLTQVFFDLACRHKGCSGDSTQNCTSDADCASLGGICRTLLPANCVPDTTTPGTNTVVGYVGNITTTCQAQGNSGSPVSWTTSTPDDPNNIVFTSSAPIMMQHDNTDVCNVEFDIQKLSTQSYDDTPLTIEERAGFMNGQCDNGLGASGENTGSLTINPTPTPRATATPTPTPTATNTSTPTRTRTALPANEICDTGGATLGEQCDNGTDLCIGGKNPGTECMKNADCTGGGTCGLGNGSARPGTVGNRDDVPGACRSNYMCPWCGDGVSDPGEQCDPGSSTSTSGPCLGNVPNSVCANGAGLCHGGGGNPNALVGCTNDGQCAIFPGCGGTCTGNPACTLAQCGDKFVCSDASCTSGNNPLNSPAGAPGPEACDDGNTSNMDSCNAFGFSFAIAGTPLVPDQCQANLCGDGATNMGVEECDAGLSVCISGPKATVPPSKPCCTNDDCGLGSVTGICSNAVAPGNSNNPGTAGTCRCSCKFPSCGDGISDTALGEQCDDGTMQNGPGKFCNKVHRCVGGENPGALCTDNSTCTKGHCGPLVCEENVCGDDVVGGNEMCDDSNTVLANGSDNCGVSATTAAAINAVLKPGCDTTLTGALANQPTACIQANCALPFCGDGITNAGEMCDSGTSTCSAALAAGAGVTLFNAGAACCTASDCKTTKTAAGVAPDVCGASPFGTGNRNDVADKCRCNCMPPSCGDGVSDRGEQCEPPASGTFCIKNAAGMCVLNTCGDDDVCNKTATDVCLTGGPSTCVPGPHTCTSGPNGGNEQCDDSNTVNPSATNTDTCFGGPNLPPGTAACQVASCGDGVTEVGEQCDPPVGGSQMGCSNMLLAGEGLAPDCCIDGEVVAPGKQIAPGLLSVNQGLDGLNCRIANLIRAAACDSRLQKMFQRVNNKIVAAEVKLETNNITGAHRTLQQAFSQVTRRKGRIIRVTQPGKACVSQATSLTEQQADASALTIGVASHLTEEVAIGFGP